MEYGEFKQTVRVQLLEEHLQIDVPSYLRTRYWEQHASAAEIADELGVHPSTVSRWLHQLHWSLRDAARLAVEAGLLPQSPYTRLHRQDDDIASGA